MRKEEQQCARDVLWNLLPAIYRFRHRPSLRRTDGRREFSSGGLRVPMMNSCYNCVPQSLITIETLVDTMRMRQVGEGRKHRDELPQEKTLRVCKPFV